jgi:phosphoserine phosphatase RsbU/P
MQPQNSPENILLVDDNPANLRLLSQILSERGYNPRAVASGPRALASVEMTPPDLILLDVRMPGMDGYEVCRQLKADPKTAGIPVLFISALDEIQDKMKAFAAGGVDYITKPFQLEEVIARVETHLALQRLQNNLQEANRHMQRQLALAAQVQASFLPKDIPQLDGWELTVALLPAQLTSGDFFDVMRLPGGDLGVLIADVVDKGVGAALFMAMSCALLRTYALEHPAQPAQVFREVNQRLLEYTATNQFVTVFFGVLEPASGRFIYSNAGHNPPLLVNPAQPGTTRMLTFCGPPLGVLKDENWGEKTVHLAAGDVLLLYTDGITEAESPDHEFFEMERLVAIVQAQAAGPAEAIQQAVLVSVNHFTQGAPLSDDIALIVLRRR